MIVAVLMRGSSVPRRKSSAKPWIDVSGVRSSCGRVGQELAKALLGGVSLYESPLDLVEHGVERRRQLVDLRALGTDLYALGQVTAGDLFGRVGHVLKRGEAPAQDQPGPGRKDQQEPDRPQQLDQHQPVERTGDIAGRQGDDDPVPVAQPGPM